LNSGGASSSLFFSPRVSPFPRGTYSFWLPPRLHPSPTLHCHLPYFRSSFKARRWPFLALLFFSPLPLSPNRRRPPLVLTVKLFSLPPLLTFFVRLRDLFVTKIPLFSLSSLQEDGPLHLLLCIVSHGRVFVRIRPALPRWERKPYPFLFLFRPSLSQGRCLSMENL